MQKTEYLARLLHLSTTGNAFCIITALLISTAVSTCAGESVMTLAMVDQHQSPTVSDVPVPTNLLSDSDCPVLNIKRGQSATSLREKEISADFTAEVRLEKPAKAGPLDSFQIVRENRTSATRSNLSFSVQAGYGRIWDEQSMLQKISAGHQETGCAYVCANFSF